MDALGAGVSAGTPTFVWADSIFLSAVWADMASELYIDKFSDLHPVTEFPGWCQINLEEFTKAVIDGKLDATDERMDHYLRISKELTDILPIDYLSIGGLDDLLRLFLSEQTATTWAGTWTNHEILTSATFEWGVMFLPPFSEDDFAGAPGTTYSVGGPTSAGQFGIPNSTAEAGDLELAVDWLMWLSAPQNFGPLATTGAGFIPLVAGTEKSPARCRALTSFSTCPIACLPATAAA